MFGEHVGAMVDAVIFKKRDDKCMDRADVDVIF